MGAPGPYELVVVRSADDWKAYHDIRQSELFATRGMATTYDRDHPDESAPGHYPLLLKWNGTGIGTTRLDLRGGEEAVIRLVAITRAEQRKGHGRELNDRVEAFGRELGVRRLFVNAAPDAVGFYERLGYLPEAWAAAELEGIASDCVQMAKPIPRRPSPSR